MNATNLRFLSVLLAAVLLGACGERLDLEVKARIDGQPAAQATVVVDREQLGVTDAQGVFAKQIRKKAGAEIDVTVSKEMPGYRIEPWKSTVLVKLPKDGQAATYRLDADLKAMRYVTFRVSEKDAPVPALSPRSVEDHGPARRSGQPAALLLPDHAQADPHRHLPGRRQHPGGGPDGGRGPDRAGARGAVVQVPGIPRSAVREAAGRGQAAQAQYRTSRRQGLAGHAAARERGHDRARQRRQGR